MGTNYEGIDHVQIILEHILEADPRTFKDPECEYGWIFDKVSEALKVLKECEYERD